MPQAKVMTNEVTYSAAVSACERSGQWQLALYYLRLMPQAKVVANEIMYSAAIGACEHGGQWQLALNMFAEPHASDQDVSKRNHLQCSHQCL